MIFIIYIFFQDVLERLLPTCLMVVPKEKREKQRKLELEMFEINKPVVVENLPFSKKTVKG